MIDQYNPFPAFRVGQREGIIEALEASKDHNAIVLNAPTGSGKSLMLSIIAKAKIAEGDWTRAIYTTPQVSLVDQLRNDRHLNITTLAGKTNYPCATLPSLNASECPVPPKRRSNDLAQFVSGGETLSVKCSECPYKLAKAAFNSASLAATTMDKLLFDKSVRRADILIMDECQGLEEKLINQSEIALPDYFDPLNPEESVKQWIRLLEMEKMKSEKIQHEFRDSFRDDRLPSPATLQKVGHAGRKVNQIERIIKKARHVLSVMTEEDQKYVIGDKKTFKLLYGREMFDRLTRNTRLVILASGTPATQILAPNAVQIKVQHPIPIERRLVKFVPVGKMSAASRQITIDTMAPYIAELHARFNRNTLVHCHSYRVAEELGNAVGDEGAKIAWMSPKSRSENIEQWKNSDGSIFMSVGCEEGLDLKGDKFPLNIVAVVPFTFRGDAWAMAREDADKKLPAEQRLGIVQTAISIQQACGRCCRDPLDFSESYILDSNFGWFFRRYNNLFQDWFTDALMVAA